MTQFGADIAGHRFGRRTVAAICCLMFLTGAALADPAPSFRQEIEPVLTRFGCNAGGCHGKQQGQNGFRLSLRGYAPELDHAWLTSEMAGRRLNPADPSQSLLILKATGDASHEGGKRFETDSDAARLLARWIAARAPGPIATEADAAKLEISLHGDSLMRVLKPGDTRQLRVTAHWPDGRSKDVTWLAQFYPTDQTTVTVTEHGLAKAIRPGEAGVRVHFQGLVGVVLFTMPRETDGDAGQYANRINAVDEHVFTKLAALRIPVSPNAEDAAFVRRAYLDAIGTLPTPAEVTTYVADARPDKRARLVDSLLARPEWVDYWTMQLCDLLQNRKERDHDVRGAKNVRAFHAWVRGQLERNRPWNELAKDVLTATGDSTGTPAVGYFVTTVGEKTNVAESDVADSVAQSFLGTRIGCARCHNHPLEKFTQDDYYHFVAFFSRVSLSRVDPDKPEKGVTALSIVSKEERDHAKEMERVAKSLADAENDLAGKSGDDLKKAQKKAADLRKRIDDGVKRLAEIRARPPTVTQPRTKKAMAAMPLDRTERPIPPGIDPRAILAAWIVDPANEQFAGAMVNRLWRHYMGVGLVEPVDDLRASNPPTNPALWKELCGQFVAGGYDLKKLTRSIMTSRAYGLSSATVPGNEQDQKFYSHYYARRLPAEVLMDAVSSATGVPDTFAGYPVGLRAVQLPDPSTASYFLTLFGR
ncbi:MAG TPA: DUF1549 domain-containing protein, partial [Tepidisphaeraceae bacterium]|nr:DUF1549 domain-containing protein [Tepidisphaeraceae bacterium]